MSLANTNTTRTTTLRKYLPTLDILTILIFIIAMIQFGYIIVYHQRYLYICMPSRLFKKCAINTCVLPTIPFKTFHALSMETTQPRQRKKNDTLNLCEIFQTLSEYLNKMIYPFSVTSAKPTVVRLRFVFDMEL